MSRDRRVLDWWILKLWKNYPESIVNSKMFKYQVINKLILAAPMIVSKTIEI